MTILTALLPLAGVVVGALATYLTSARIQRSLWERNQTVRWDERRLMAYIDYGNAVKRMSNLASRIAAGRGYDHTVEPLSPQEGLPKLAGLEADRAACWEAVLLLGDTDTIRAARDWHRAVWRIEFYARGLLNDSAAWRTAIIDTDDARHAFYEAARKDLGMSPPINDGPLWPPHWHPDHPARDGDPSER
jgi:hypothetical protein